MQTQLCSPRQKTIWYEARLQLQQRKQWLNRGIDWNNPSVCALVPQTSCLTKPNPCWCWAFRSFLSVFCFCLTLFSSNICSLFLSFWLGPGPLFGSLVTGPIHFFHACSQQQCTVSLWGVGGGTREKGMEKKRGWTQMGGHKVDIGERWNRRDIES